MEHGDCVRRAFPASDDPTPNQRQWLNPRKTVQVSVRNRGITERTTGTIPCPGQTAILQ